MAAKTRILFVCLGNICRSPTAHAVVEEWVRRRGLGNMIEIDSCGTGDWHIGRAPDERASETAARRGYNLSALRARQLHSSDFERFDLILTMDEANLHDVSKQRPAGFEGTIDLFLRYSGIDERHEVPDPYYGGEDGFSEVLELIERATGQLLDRIAALQASPDSVQ